MLSILLDKIYNGAGNVNQPIKNEEVHPGHFKGQQGVSKFPNLPFTKTVVVALCSDCITMVNSINLNQI